MVHMAIDDRAILFNFFLAEYEFKHMEDLQSGNAFDVNFQSGVKTAIDFYYHQFKSSKISAIKEKMIGYLNETRETMDHLFEDGKQYSRDIYMFYAGVHEFCVWVTDDDE